MKKSITKNFIYNMLYQLTALIIPLITTPYISRVLGAEAIGIYSYTLSITTYFILFGTLGISLYGQREIAYLQDNKEKRSKTFWEIIILRFITLIISMILFYISFGINNEYKIYYRVLLIEMLTHCLDVSWFFQGMEEFKRTVLKNIMIRLVSLIAIFTYIKTPNDLLKYFIIYVLSNFFGNLSLWMYLPKYIEKINLRQINVKKHIKPTISLFIPQIAVQIYNVLDRTMLGALISDKREVGYYEQAQKYIKVLLTTEGSLVTVMIPRVANSFIKGEKNKVTEYITKSMKFVAFFAFPLILGTIAIIKQFVPLFYGEGYEKVGYIIMIICPIVLFFGLSNILGAQFLLPTKQQKKYTIAVISGAIINFILNILLIKKYNSFGASLATVFAEFSVLVIEIYMTRKQVDIKNVFRNLLKYGCSATIMYMIIKIWDLTNLSYLSNIGLKIISGGFIYFGLLFFVFRDRFIVEFISKIINKIKFKKKEIN